MSERSFQEGEILFEQGDPANTVFVVLEGQIDILYKPYDGPQLIVAHIQPDGVLGWSAALGHPYYTSSAICKSDGIALEINGNRMRCLCLQHPDTGVILLERLAEVIAERLRTTQEQVVRILSSEMEYNESCVERRNANG